MKLQLEGVKLELDGKGKSLVKGGVGMGTPRRGGQGRMLGQVNELWGHVEEIRRRKKGRGGDVREGWLGDEKALAEVAEVSCQIFRWRVTALSVDFGPRRFWRHSNSLFRDYPTC